MQPLQLSMTSASQSKAEEAPTAQSIFKTIATNSQSNAASPTSFAAFFNERSPMVEEAAEVETDPMGVENNASDVDQTREIRVTPEVDDALRVSELDAGSAELEEPNTDILQYSDASNPLVIGEEFPSELAANYAVDDHRGQLQIYGPVASHHNEGETQAATSSFLMRNENNSHRYADGEQPAPPNENKNMAMLAPIALSDLTFGSQTVSHLSTATRPESGTAEKVSDANMVPERQVSQSGQQINPLANLNLASIEVSSTSAKPDNAGLRTTLGDAHGFGKIDQDKPQDASLRVAIQNSEPSMMRAPHAAEKTAHVNGMSTVNQIQLTRYSSGSSETASSKGQPKLNTEKSFAVPLTGEGLSAHLKSHVAAATESTHQPRHKAHGTEEAVMWSPALTKTKPRYPAIGAPPSLASASAGLSLANEAFLLVAKDSADLQKITPLEALSEASWDAPRVISSSAGALATRPETPQMLARQLAEGLQSGTGRPVDLTLNPEELGRVRLSLSSLENGITVNILAERGETLELMRRHIEQLAQEFRGLGYENVTFSFGEGQQPNATGHEKNDDEADGASTADTDHCETIQEAKSMHLSTGSAAGLDLRL